jgi:3',5'-cyclic AMP phosphodiesterase CpdA
MTGGGTWMSLILFLTDLHLGRGGAGRPADDRKVRVISDAERTSIREVAEQHIRRLATSIRQQGKQISALVLGGDITMRGEAAGFSELNEFLQSGLGDLLPPAHRIVVTPGNHDVAWYETDAKVRYENFIKYCVDYGYVTPPLDGIDLGPSAPDFVPDRHVLIDSEGWFIAPLNSSHWSGTRAPLLDENDEELPEAAIDGLRKALSGDAINAQLVEQLLRFRQYDMARVSRDQIGAFQKTIAFARKAVGDVHDALPLVAMHHQLLPVGEREEIKPFESLSNLGRVRAVFEENGIGVTLHGHKHDLLTMWNTTEHGSVDGRGVRKHEMLVVSGGTIGGAGIPDTGRLATVLEISRKLRGHEVAVRSVADFIAERQAETRGYFLSGRRFEPLGASGGHIQATSFSDGYARLVAEGGATQGSVVKNLSITIQDLSEVDSPPTGYPEDAAGALGALPLPDWFNQVADWWQSVLVDAPRGVFTHGRRLKLHGGKIDANQITKMIETLADRRSTNGRAVATLIDAESDLLGKGGPAPASFPAFCLLQLHIRTSGSDTFLDATAYFRKQEMKYWWPVNIAEIKRVMVTVSEALKDVKLGSITTTAAIAVWQTTRSRVSVPAIDRMFLQNDDGRRDLMRMAALVAQPESTALAEERNRLIQLWRIALEDVVPPEEAVMDSIPVAIEGVCFLRDAVQAQHDIAGDPNIRTRLSNFAKLLTDLEERGTRLWSLGREAKPGNSQRKLSSEVKAMDTARHQLAELVEKLANSEHQHEP